MAYNLIIESTLFSISLRAITSAAVFEGVQIKIFFPLLHKFNLSNCKMVSTTVDVFPVPGGPKRIKGAGNDDLLIIFVMACFCSVLCVIDLLIKESSSILIMFYVLLNFVGFNLVLIIEVVKFSRAK